MHSIINSKNLSLWWQTTKRYRQDLTEDFSYLDDLFLFFGREGAFIEKDKPYQNGIAESFMDKLKYKCLNLNTFKNIEEAKEIIGNYIDFKSRKRPHGSLSYKTPVEFERSLAII